MLHVAVATRAFRRYSTYRAATLAGIFTNSVFGIIYSYAYLALWDANPTAGGYDAQDAVTYVWLGQALLMTIALWGGGTTDDLAERIRTGDVAIDLYRPVGLVGWYLASDLGRAAYHLLTRGLGPTVIGYVVFDIAPPVLPADRARLRRVAGARGRRELRDPLPRRQHRLLAAGPVGREGDERGLRDLLQRDDAAAGALPRVARHARAGAAVGVVRPGARGHLARQAHGRPDLLAALGLPGVLGRRRCSAACQGVARRRPARWWSRVAESRRRCCTCAPTLQIAWLWIRAAWQYPTSFVLLAVGNGLITALDFVGLWIMFAHLDDLAGFTLPEVALLYGAASLALGVADTAIGSVERIGSYIRTGRLDQMMTKPVPLLVQVCADQFTLRRLGRLTQATDRVRRGRAPTSTGPRRGSLVAVSMVVSGGLIFFGALRRLLVRPVLDDRRHGVRQRLHLRRRHGDAVPAQHLPARGASSG